MQKEMLPAGSINSQSPVWFTCRRIFSPNGAASSRVLLSQLGAAKLVTSRAGATTLAELACAGCPTIAIPYPHAADDHQRLNAAAYETAGAALVIKQQHSAEGTAKTLVSSIKELLADTNRRQSMGQAMHSLASPAAAPAVTDIVETVMENRIHR